MYAVIDLETTGLCANGHDRALEVAVLHVDEAGAPEREWCTLVNPQRDPGPQHVHGIRAAEVLHAPTFADVAAELCRLLAGRVVVAHNLRFDVRFLHAEYARLGVDLPATVDDGLCTMELAAHYLPGSGRRLADCCVEAGVAHSEAHSALGDARATAGLLAYYLRSTGQPPPWAARCTRAARAPWPTLAGAAVSPVHRRSTEAVDDRGGAQYLSRLVARLPRVGKADADAYLDLLDRALLDRHLSATEEHELLEFAASVGLGRAQVVELHERYLHDLVALALADGVVTADERADLEQVTHLLGLEPARLDKALSEGPAGASGRWGGFALSPGDVVVFTGQGEEPRDVAEKRAADAGLVPRSAVTKRTRLVVAADPDTSSGKARKARSYGIPIVTPEAFWDLVAQLPDAG